MRLIRFAIVTFFSQSSIQSGRTVLFDVEVTMAQGESKGQKNQVFLFTAKTDLENVPTKDSEGRLVIPRVVRERCESAIESLANIISTFHGCSRSVMSPIPCLALEATSSEQTRYLEDSHGVLGSHRGEAGARVSVPLRAEYLTAVSGRLDGVGLLAEAYSGGELGRYREFLRFFELAFLRPISSLSKKLHQFLGPAPFGYTHAEIKQWIAHRDPVSHADLKRASALGIASDVRPYLLRIEQAAIDVLFNKSVWKDPSSARRQVWLPDAYTTSAVGAIAVKQGTNLSMLFRMYDEFGVYPRILGVRFAKIEDSWYMKMADGDLPTAPRSEA